MLDTHCHLLPALDDGPPNLGAAVALAGQLLQAGVTRVLCTPHFSWQFPTDHELALERLDELRATLAEVRVELPLDLAAEVSPAMAMGAPKEQLHARSVARRFLLVEVQHDTSDTVLRTASERVFDLGLTPILAHPERARSLRRHLKELEALREAGALIQVVAPSVIGNAGRDARRAAWELVERGLVDLLASDAHGSWRSPADLAAAVSLLDEGIGIEHRLPLTGRNPELLLTGIHPRDHVAASE